MSADTTHDSPSANKKIKTIASPQTPTTDASEETLLSGGGGGGGGLRKRRSRCSSLSPQQQSPLSSPSSILAKSSSLLSSSSASSSGELVENKSLESQSLYSLNVDDDNDIFDESEMCNLSNRALTMLPMDFQKTLLGKSGSALVVKYLDLSANQLSVLPAWFFQNAQLNQQLIRLDLSQNNFFEVQNGLSKMNHLKYLNLSNNRLAQFPTAVLQCSELMSLDLSDNSIELLPRDVSQLQNLRELDISDNSLLSLPESVIDMKNLNQFYLQNNKFIDSIHHILSEMQKNNPQLKISQMDTEKEKRKSGPVRRTIANRVKSKQDRLHALKELLKSEKQYCFFLNVMYNEFYKQLTLRADSNCTLDFSKVELADDIKKAMFPTGLAAIVNFNLQLLAEIEKCIKVDNDEILDKSEVGNVFIERAAFFKVYSNYISGYHSAHRLLMKTINENEEFAKVIQKGRSLPGVNGIDLPSLLIMPIQRIPRYVLLLKAIAENTDSFHPDFKSLNKAIELMSDNATYVNKKIAEAANLRKVMDIQQELNFQDLVAPHRTFVKEGNLHLRKTGQDITQESQVKLFLFNDLLVITEFKLLYALFGDFIRRYELDQVELQNCTEENEFDLVVPSFDKSYRIRANNSTEKSAWFNAIQKYIEESTVE